MLNHSLTDFQQEDTLSLSFSLLWDLFYILIYQSTIYFFLVLLSSEYRCSKLSIFLKKRLQKKLLLFTLYSLALALLLINYMKYNIPWMRKINNEIRCHYMIMIIHCIQYTIEIFFITTIINIIRME